MRRVASALLLAVLAAACGEAPEPTGDRVVLDALGAPVPLPAVVRRVVTTLPGLTETVVALGAGDRLVGVAAIVGVEGVESDPATIPGVTVLSVSPAVSTEAVAALSPDLLLVDPTLSPADLPRLRERFPFTFACDSRSLDGLRSTFRALGEALGRLDDAARLVTALDAARREARVEGRPRVLLLTWADPPMALGPGALLDDMVRSVGAENVAADMGRASGEYSSERIRAKAPEVILLTGGRFPDALRASWASVPAVRDDRIRDVGDGEFVRAGPRTASALRRLPALLGPAAPRGSDR